jgi:hypothetical protein
MKTPACLLCKASPCNCRSLIIPVHPEEVDVPVSVIHIPISNGRFVRFCGPMAPKTLTILLGVMQACKPALVSPDPGQTFEI